MRQQLTAQINDSEKLRSIDTASGLGVVLRRILRERALYSCGKVTYLPELFEGNKYRDG